MLRAFHPGIFRHNSTLGGHLLVNIPPRQKRPYPGEKKLVEKTQRKPRRKPRRKTPEKTPPPTRWGQVPPTASRRSFCGVKINAFPIVHEPKVTPFPGSNTIWKNAQGPVRLQNSGENSASDKVGPGSPHSRRSFCGAAINAFPIVLEPKVTPFPCSKPRGKCTASGATAKGWKILRPRFPQVC